MVKEPWPREIHEGALRALRARGTGNTRSVRRVCWEQDAIYSHHAEHDEAAAGEVHAPLRLAQLVELPEENTAGELRGLQETSRRDGKRGETRDEKRDHYS